MGIILESCSEDSATEPPQPPVTVTINLNQADSAINHYLWAYVFAENETDINNPDKVGAVMYKQITETSISFVLQQDDGNGMPNGELWEPTINLNYDMYVYTDSDDDGDPETGPTAGKIIGAYPASISSHGGLSGTISYNYPNYDTWDYSRTLPVTLDTDTINISGHYLWATIYNENETDVNNPDKVVATMFTQIQNRYPKVTLQESDGNWNPNGTEWKGEIGETYDIYVYTDSDDDNNPETGPTVGKIIDPAPQTVFIKGYQSFTVEYGDMIDYE
ncbi:MAG: hypothetical protein KAH33_03400 [Candidatus Delongbacteria bacterium]|nr:hypothetical protein [Candidatus Delongbacteria bacterium]